MSNIKDLPGITLTRREVEMVWALLPKYLKSGRQRYEHPLFSRLGAIAEPGDAAPSHYRAEERAADPVREAAIVAAARAGERGTAIAKRFGVSKQRVHQILQRNPRPRPAWLTPEWRAGFERELEAAGVLARSPLSNTEESNG